MSVYVDTARKPLGSMLMSHLWADTRPELFDMVDHIRVSRRWFQKPPRARWEHFDVSEPKRELAIHAGALVTDKYGPLEHVARLNGDQATLDRIAVLRARKASS